MALVPFVERIDVNQEKSPLHVGQQRVGLKRDRRLERLSDAPFARAGRKRPVLRARPVVRDIAGFEGRRRVTGAGVDPPVGDTVESRIDTINVGMSRSASLSRPHQLTLIAPAPAPFIHAAWCSMTFVERES
jgi:hypothetical protein